MSTEHSVTLLRYDYDTFGVHVLWEVPNSESVIPLPQPRASATELSDRTPVRIIHRDSRK